MTLNASSPAPVYGLVLSGGASRRMQHDKALIDYHGETQLHWTYRLLASLLPRVFVSVREDQRDETVRREFPQIVDIYATWVPPPAFFLRKPCTPTSPGWWSPATCQNSTRRRCDACLNRATRRGKPPRLPAAMTACPSRFAHFGNRPATQNSWRVLRLASPVRAKP